MERPKYLRKEIVNKLSTGDDVRVLIKMRLGNMEKGNIYWLGEEKRRCRFCKEELDILEHYIEEYKIVSEWFKDVGKNKEERLR